MNNSHQNWFVGLPVQDTGWFGGVVGACPEHSERKTPHSLRVFDANDLHLTVAFLGQCDFQYTTDVREIIDTISFTPFTITFDTLTTFPPERRPTVVSFTLRDGYDATCELISRWREPLLTAGRARPDTREPLPHVTVARIHRDAGERTIEDITAWAHSRPVPPVSLTIDRVALYTWADDRRERQFQIVHEKRMG